MSDGKFKEKFANSKFNGFLQKVGGAVKDNGVAVASIVLKAATGNISGAISDTAQLVAKHGDRALNDEWNDQMIEYKKELIALDIVREQEVTKRWQADMGSDSWLSKNIRPLTLAFLLVAITVLCVLDSVENKFTINDQWIYLFGSLSVTAVGGYFALRQWGKRNDSKYGTRT